MIIPDPIISVATTVVKPLIGDYIKSTFNEYAKKAKISYNKLLVPLGQHFEEYLNRTYNKFSDINVWALNNSKRRLKDLYVPLSIKMEEERYKETIVDCLPVSLIKDYKKILITVTAGMGKSTMMRYMFIDLLEKGLKEVGIPIYIELNRLRKNWTILDEIKKQLNSLTKEFDSSLLLDLIRTEQYVFFMDGYDEIPVDDKTEVTDNLNEFISKAGERNYFILTSRPEDRLSSLDGFHHFHICPLKKEEAYELLEKCDLSDHKETSKRLITKLDSNEYKPIHEYLENPLLVSLLFAAFEYSPDLPLKKHQFYRQVYNALFMRHDLSKGIDPHEKKSHLDIDDFSRVLRYVGFECLKRGYTNFDEDSILCLIRKAKEKYGSLKFSESSFLDDLLLAVPLFTKDGTEYKWAHKSLMEYFAARFIADDVKNDQDNILTAIYNSEHIEKYINMLDLYYDLDYESFSKNITYPMCNDFINYCDSNSFYRSTLHDCLVKERVALLFAHSVVITQVLYGSDEDSEIENEAKQVLACFNATQHNKYNYIGEIASGIFAASFSNNWTLIKLLFDKQVSLFHAYGQRYTDIEIDSLCFFENKVAIPITVKLGENDINTYLSINKLLRLWCFSKGFLNYDECKKTIQKIYDNYINVKNKPDYTTGI